MVITRVGIKGRYSDRTFVGGGVKVNKNGASGQAYIGKEYKAGGNIKVNGKEVAKLNGGLKAQTGKIGMDKNKGFNVGTWANGQANGEIKIGNIDTKFNLSSDFNVKAKIDKKGFHLDVKGGIHTGLDMKDTKIGI